MGDSTHVGRRALRSGRARRPRRWRPRASERSSLVKMLLRCRSIVRSLRKSSAAMALLVLPAATSLSTCNSRFVRPWLHRERRPSRALRAGRDRARRRASGRPSRRPPTPARRPPRQPRLRQADPASSRARAAWYGASARCKRSNALRSEHSAASAAPSASWIAPRACAAIATERVGVEAPRRRFQLAAGTLCALGLAGGEHDLDAGRQQPRAPEAAGGGARGHGRSPRRRRRRFLPPAAAGRARAAGRTRRGWRSDSPLGRRETRPAGGAPRPAGRMPRAAVRLEVPSARSRARLRLLDRACQSPCSCRISARCTRQTPVKAGEVGLAPARQGGGPLACTADRVNRHGRPG